MLGKPKRTSPSGTTSSRYRPLRRRRDAGLDDAVDRRLAGLRVGAERLLLDRREAAVGVARREAARSRAWRSSVAAFATERFSSSPSAGIRGARRHQVLHADQLAGLLEDASSRRAATSRSNAHAHRGIRGEAGRGVGAAADRADGELVDPHRHRLLALDDPATSRSTHAAARGDRLAASRRCPGCRASRPAGRRPRSSARGRRLSKPSQPSDTSSAPPTLGCVHSFSIIASDVRVRIAAREADQMHAALAKRRRDLARDVMRALDEIGDDEDVADALAAVGAKIAVQRLHVSAPSRMISPRHACTSGR